MKKNLPIFLFLITLAFLATNVRAQEQRTLVVIPPKLELSVKPGESVQEVIKYKNQTSDTVEVAVGMSDCLVKGMSGTVELVNPEEAGDWALSQWLTFSPTSLTIPPDGEGRVNVFIAVPADALPGGRYASIYFTSPGAVVEGQTGTSIATEIRNLVLLRVEGPINEEALVRRFQTPRFSEFGPIQFLTEIANLGDYHIRPIGSIEIKNILGKTEANLELEERNVFPTSSQEYKNTWDKKWLFGRYQATLTATYGEQNLPLTASIFFWVWPMKYTLAVLGLIALFIILLFLVKKIKNRQEMKAEVVEEELEEETPVEEKKGKK
ncbi:MAG: hypothetical protein MUP45_00670 [Candidatus Marinimicrobia bacterium]|nr:hypothetical protein [Candidatus Neomarinimicrobiota bacterium]